MHRLIIKKPMYECIAPAMASVTAQCMQQTTAFATVRAGKTAM